MDHKPPDERTVKLGKTIRILHTRLPTLLASPLPQEILSPQISLRLFPSTHPHLPTVTGKIGYTAALWTSPVAWGRVPVVGNVKLIILSERMVKGGHNSSGAERLVVRWKTCGKSRLNIKGVGTVNLENLWGVGDSNTSSTAASSKQVVDSSKNKEFWGLFIFEFDEKGRILTHTIEHAEEGGNDERMTKVVSVTDWLLGKAWGNREREENVPGLALGCEIEEECDEDGRKRRIGR
ncbi:hypothetical protein EJ08DRAFT_609322 [Tothia fuscella]|uniref:Uncharacterized protein n=1 Tax=Tothia fuscella TaxID=1048955 RepID=A0A9P4NVU1_9PEZI|nr:hypothetical protein EJ08DRAFT_609322 [Tothia fuscella]